MKKFAIAAALLLITSTAQAGQNYSFEIGGRTVRIHAPRGCDSPSCISISIPGLYGAGRRGFDDDSSGIQDAAQAATPAAAPAQAAAPATPPVTAAPVAPAIVTPPAQQTAAPVHTPTAAIVPPTQPGVTTTPTREPAKATVVAATSPAAESVQTPPPPVAEPVGPLGVWLTEKKEGQVRIEECGANLCGYSVDTRTGRNKEKILINMKPIGSKWRGKIYDPKSGSTYSSTIAMKGQDGLRVQGCAFGGMFCGGQTWSRLN